MDWLYGTFALLLALPSLVLLGRAMFGSDEHLDERTCPACGGTRVITSPDHWDPNAHTYTATIVVDCPRCARGEE